MKARSSPEGFSTTYVPPGCMAPDILADLKTPFSRIPLGAFSGERALVEVVAQRELEPRAADADLARAAGYLELARLLRVGHALDEGGLAEQEAHLVEF